MLDIQYDPMAMTLTCFACPNADQNWLSFPSFIKTMSWLQFSFIKDRRISLDVHRHLNLKLTRTNRSIPSCSRPITLDKLILRIFATRTFPDIVSSGYSERTPGRLRVPTVSVG